MSDRLVVAFVTDAIYPYHNGGKESRYYELSQRLSSEFDVHVYTMRWWSGDRIQRSGSVTLHGICPRVPLYANGRRSIAQALMFAIGCLRLLTAKFDILEVDHMPYFHLLVLRVVASVRRRPLVVTWHEVWGRTYWTKYLGPAGRIAALIELLSARLPDHIIAASPQTAERIDRTLSVKAPVTVIPNGVDLEAIGHAMPVGTPTDLVVVGRLIDHKRVDLVLDAMTILRAAKRDITCRVIGSGPRAAELQNYAMRLGLLSSVDFRDDLREQTELYQSMKASKVLVLASEREGFGIAALEGLACGLAVVTTTAPDNLAQHLVSRAPLGFVCEATAEALARAISIAGNAYDASAADGPGRWHEQYSWSATATAVADTLNEVHKRRKETPIRGAKLPRRT